MKKKDSTEMSKLFHIIADKTGILERLFQSNPAALSVVDLKTKCEVPPDWSENT